MGDRKRKKTEPVAVAKQEPVVVSLGRAGAHYTCNYCGRELSGMPRIKCAECPDFDLCTDCFAAGATLHPHKPDHDYRVMDNMDRPLYFEDWGADEELLLLDGIDMYGLGSWADVASHVGTKSKTMCEAHYYATYVDTPRAPLPPDNPSPLAPISDAKYVEAAAKAVANGKVEKGGACGDYVGYCSHRGDFETEWENDAEAIVCDLVFDNDNETEFERELKQELLRMYNTKLDGRAHRKRIMLARSLIDFRKVQAAERRRTKEEKEVIYHLKPFMRFLTPDHYNNLLSLILPENRIRRRMEQLQSWREAGVKSLADGEAYELEKKKREVVQEPVRSRGGRPAAPALQLSRTLSAATPSTRPLSRWLMRDKDEVEGKAKVGRKAAAPMDLSGLAGVDLLSAKERDLCAALRLQPMPYLQAKATLTTACVQMSSLSRAMARQLLKLEPKQCNAIYDHLLGSGLVRSPASASATPSIGVYTPASTPAMTPSSTM